MCIKRSYGRDNHPFVIIFVCLFFSVLLRFVAVVIFLLFVFFLMSRWHLAITHPWQERESVRDNG